MSCFQNRMQYLALTIRTELCYIIILVISFVVCRSLVDFLKPPVQVRSYGSCHWRKSTGSCVRAPLLTCPTLVVALAALLQPLSSSSSMWTLRRCVHIRCWHPEVCFAALCLSESASNHQKSGRKAWLVCSSL